MTKYLCALAAGALFSLVVPAFTMAADKAPSTAPATKPAALPDCCGDACKKMGSGCCKTDDKGKATCSMGGGCCAKTDKPAGAKPAGGDMGGMHGMGGMNMGK